MNKTEKQFTEILNSLSPLLEAHNCFMENELEKLKNDNNLITFYEEGELKEKTVGEVAAKAIAKLV